MEIIRNLTRRKLRNFLTISGIVIGVLALVTMGSMAEKFNALLAGGATYFSSNVQVADESSSSQGFGGALMPLSKVTEIEQVSGVAIAFAEIGVSAKPGGNAGVSFGIPDYISSTDPKANDYSKFKVSLARGRDITNASQGEVVLGADFASEFKKKVGDALDLPIRPTDARPDFVNHTFTVVGILNKTQTAPDSGAFVSLTDAQLLLKDSLPAAIRGSVDTSQLATGITVYGNPGVNLDQLADRINREVAGVKATKPSQLVASFNAGAAIFTAVTTGAALLALVVGGLSMLMAVTERVREIGLKKAVGARVGHILREFLLEAVVIGAIGGAIGLFLGWGLTTLVNLGAPTLSLFLVTWRLVIVALVFSVGLGAVAGIIPAFRAARMDPVRALRAQ